MIGVSRLLSHGAFTIRLVVVMVLASLGGALAAEQPADVPGNGKGRYIMVLVAPSPQDDGKTHGKPSNVPEPDIAAIGGTLHFSRDEIRVVTLPLAAVKQLKKHERVAYLQRVWMGESLDDWEEESTAGNASPRMATDAEMDPTGWTTGTYEYDGSGNIWKTGADTYSYDTAGRLIESTVNGIGETYEYDSFGNLKAKTAAGVAESRVVDLSSNRFAAETYDAAGNQLTDSSRPAGVTRPFDVAYEYDSFSMMTYVRTRVGQTKRMIYTADDERIGTIINATIPRWSIRDFNGRVLREFEGVGMLTDWLWQEDYIYADGLLVGGERQWYYGGTRHFHLDHLGTVRLVTDASKQSISRHDFRPFGVEQTNPYGEKANFLLRDRNEPMKFTSHERDWHGASNVENDDYLDYMHARYYDPRLGRFLSVDPVLDLKANLPSPQRWNRYSYVSNNPINKIDPDGRDEYAMDQRLSGIEDDWHGRDKYQAAGMAAGAVAVGVGVVVAPAVGAFWAANKVSILLAAMGFGNAVLGPGGGPSMPATGAVVQRLSSAIGRDNLLMKAAQVAGKSHQGSIDKLTSELARGNLNPGIGTKNLFGNVMYARARDGARVFFRQGRDGSVEILAKANKSNEAQVIKRLEDLYNK